MASTGARILLFLHGGEGHGQLSVGALEVVELLLEGESVFVGLDDEVPQSVDVLQETELLRHRLLH